MTIEPARLQRSDRAFVLMLGAAMSRLQLAFEQITFVRSYTTRLLDSIKLDDWFRQPAGGVTHVAWQVGHLAMAEYRLALERLRGVRPEDADLIPQAFFTL